MSELNIIPSGWLPIEFDDCFLTINPTFKIKQAEYLKSGQVAVVDQGKELVGGYSNDASKQVNVELPAIVFGDHTRIFKYINFNFIAGADGVKIIKPITPLSEKFFFYFFNNALKKIPNKGYSRHFQHLKRVAFFLPPLNEQHRIVSKIEELFSELDNGVANLKRAQNQLKVYRQALLKHAFEGKLTEQWRKENNPEPAKKLLERIKEERQQRYEQELKDWKAAVMAWEKDGKQVRKPGKPRKLKELTPFTKVELNEFPELPALWEWVKIDKLTEYSPYAIKAGPFGSSLKKEFYVEKGYKIYGQEQVISGDAHFGNYYVDEEKFEELSSCRTKPYDALISLVGTVGKVLVLPENAEDGIINPRLVKLSLDNNYYSPFLFKFFFESYFLKSLYSIHTHGATMDVLNLGIIQGLPFPLMSKEEQEKIVNEIALQFSIIDNLEHTIKSGLQKSEALRQSILKKAFEGKLVHQDPNDEPASELLKRIQAEKKKYLEEQQKLKKKKRTKKLVEA